MKCEPAPTQALSPDLPACRLAERRSGVKTKIKKSEDLETPSRNAEE